MSDSNADSFAENLNHHAQEAHDSTERAYNAARDYAAQGRGYIGEVGGRVSRFVNDEPWIAVACAFAIGYAVAQVVKRMS